MRALVALAILVALAGRARAGDGVDLLRFMPGDIDMYMVVDVAAARDAPMFKDAMASLAKAMPAKVAVVVGAGFDPTDIDTVAMGDHEADTSTFVAVIEGKAAEKIAARVGKSSAFQATTYHGVTYWTSSGAAVAVVDHRLIFCRPPQIEHAVDVAIGKQVSVAKAASAQPLRDAIAATDTRNDVWLAIVPPAEAAAKLHAKGVDVTAVSAAAGLSDVLTAELVVETGGDAAAKKLYSVLDKDAGKVVPALERAGLAEAAKTYDARLDGPTVHIAITLTEPDLAKLGAAVPRRHRRP